MEPEKQNGGVSMSIFKDEDSVYRNSEEFQSNAADPKSITKPIHVMGKIIDIKMKGLSHPAQITVLYRVGKQSFLLYDTVKYKKESIKIGPIPIGKKQYPKLGSVTAGKEVLVACDYDNHEMAYLPENLNSDHV